MSTQSIQLWKLVECVHAPFWIDTAHVNRKLNQEIKATLESEQAA